MRSQVGVGVIELVRVRQHRRIDLHFVFLHAAAFVDVAASVTHVILRVPVVGDLALGHVQHRGDVGPLGLEGSQRAFPRERGGQRHQVRIDVEAEVRGLADEGGGRTAAPGRQQGAGEGKGQGTQRALLTAGATLVRYLIGLITHSSVALSTTCTFAVAGVQSNEAAAPSV